MILVPFKNRQNAKQRLMPVLNAGERARLAEAMLEDVLDILARWAERPPVAVVTSDSFARALAQRFAFDVLNDPANDGETQAVAEATRLAEGQGAWETLVLPGDIPLVQVGELRAIFAAAPAKGTVLVPSASGRGTNAVLRRPAGLFPLSFGDDSFRPHLQAARATGWPTRVLHLGGVGLDVDTPADLAALLAARGDTRAQRLLRGWHMEERLHEVAAG
ncbi:MAG: 2-phospho-L-lactate guanylyltransferase [Terriglobia bacterium]